MTQMTRFLWEASLNDVRLLAGEEVGPLVGWDYSPIQVDPGSLGAGLLDTTGFIAVLSKAGVTRLELLCRIDAIEDPWWRASVEELMLVARPLDLVWSLRSWYDHDWPVLDRPPGSWRHELFPSEWPTARQWNLGECRRRLRAALANFADHPDKGYRETIRGIRSLLTDESATASVDGGPDQRAMPPRPTAPKEAAGLFASALQLIGVPIFHNGGLVDYGGVDGNQAGELVLSHLQTLAALTRL